MLQYQFFSISYQNNFLKSAQSPIILCSAIKVLCENFQYRTFLQNFYCFIYIYYFLHFCFTFTKQQLKRLTLQLNFMIFQYSHHYQSPLTTFPSFFLISFPTTTVNSFKYFILFQEQQSNNIPFRKYFNPPMNQFRIQTMPPSFMQDSKLLLKILEKISKDLSTHDKSDQFTKKNISMYLNTFALQIGINPATDNQLSTICSYLEDPPKNYITKTKFHRLLKNCMTLYIESKRQPIGGIIDRLIVMLRNEALRDKQRALEIRD